ncbi:uncharacterized protein V1513DRAFT_428524 [Lipomyces chichibuensis]|uniref:uncharacterized protein n=1 Tax=Lipomyces chichibuensis TaxID=1546026 RepID=UPI00334406B4
MDKNVVHHHGPIAAEIPVPHGGQDYDSINGQIVDDSEISDGAALDSKDEKAIFSYLLHPDDSYDENGTYWADMKFGQKVSFITKVDNAEAKRELGNLWTMFKNDPLSPVSWYFRDCVIPGLGLGLEGYVLFSIGNVTPLFQKAKSATAHGLLRQHIWKFVVLLSDKIMVGLLGDSIGRRFGLIQDAVIMLIGLIMLTASWGVTLNGWVICYAWSLFFYSVGVGGEYPMTATSGMENGVGSGKVSTKEDRLHRGRKVLLAFLMQGWGQFFNQVLLILLLLIFHHGSGNPPYSELALAKKKAKVTGYDMDLLKLSFTYFGPRMIATCIAWFAEPA